MIELSDKLLKGGWCDIYDIKGSPDRCAKVLAPHRKYKGTHPHPNIIVQKKYGIKDLLAYEFSNYQKIISKTPAELRDFIVQIHGLDKTVDGQKALVLDKVIDDQGVLAKSLVKNTRALQPIFLERLECLRKEVFLKHSIDHFGIVTRNILIKSPKHPVIIDFQEGRERYPGQLWLRIPFFVRAKVNRCFAKLYQELNVSFPTT
jgi:RIO kinase 1